MPERVAIDVPEVLRRLEKDETPLHLEVVTSTGSTNADLLAAAAAGAPDRTVRVADLQTAGRGRHADRVWTSPPRAGLTFSVLRRIGENWARTWIPLMVGTGVCEALSSLGVDGLTLKWPNDVRLDGRKLGGILTQATRDAVVIGVGLNVTTTREELPNDAATSLALARPDLRLDREAVLVGILQAIEWPSDEPAEPGVPRREYLRWCETVGQSVLVTPIADEPYRATAVDIDDNGALVLDGATGRHTVSAGEIQTLRDGTEDR